MSNALAISTTIIGLVINAVGIIFVAVQVVLARRQIEDDGAVARQEAARIKRQATVDFFMSTQPKVAEWRSVLPDDWDKPEIDAYVTKVYEPGSKEKMLILASYLAYFETLAIAIRGNVYDLPVFDSIAGIRIINICDNYQGFFRKRREEVGSQNAYKNLEWLAEALRCHRDQDGYDHHPLTSDIRVPEGQYA